MKVYTVLLHDLPAGDDYVLGVYISREQAEKETKNFIEQTGYKFSIEVQESYTGRWIYYYDCTYNPECENNLDIHYTAELEEFELNT